MLTFGKTDMSNTRSLEISLSEMVEQSNLVLKVRFREVFEEHVPVVDKSLGQTGREIQPFVKRGCVFEVSGVLKNTARIEVPGEIRVPDENWRRLLGQYREKHANGPVKSYTVPVYNTDVPSIKKASIIFLVHFQGMFDLTAKDAFENLDAEEKVVILVAG